jgi:fimbrial isopeptide formation D2 family protein/LPXTG-motif cell wall-anchored protein
MKHRLHKLFAAFLAVMLLVSCTSIMAFAADNDSETGHTYELYQIFTGDFNESNNILSNIAWGKNGKIPTGSKVGDLVSDEIVAELKAVADTSTQTHTNSEKMKVIEKYVNLESTAFKSASAADQPTADGKNGLVYSGIPAGYYLIKDSAGSQASTNDEGEIVTGTNYTYYVVKATGGTLLFEPKGGIPTVSKKVKEDTSWVDANSASMGEDVNYQITGTVSDLIADYATYFYRFNDTLSKGLDFKTGSVKVYLVNGTGATATRDDITKYFYVNAATQTDKTTKLTIAIQDLNQLLNVKDGDAAKYTLNGNSQIVVEYTAVLNKDAVQATDSNDNTVNITYSNDPNHSGTPSENPPEENPKNPPEPDENSPTGETVNSETKTYTTALVITKKNESDAILTGAEFTLTGASTQIAVITRDVFVEVDETATEEEDVEGEDVPEEADVDDDTVYYYKLKDGTYTTTAPVIADDATDTSAKYESTETRYTKETRTEVKGAGQTETTIKAEVGDDGVVKFTGLGAGEYTLSETKAPAGYNKMSDVTFTITFKDTDKTFSAGGLSYDKDDGEFDYLVIDKPGSALPRTGGIGTTIFYVAGTAMILCAGILLISKKRMKREGE